MVRRSAVPVWLMGLTNSILGMYTGILVFSLPPFLRTLDVPESTIASMTAVMMSPGFWAFLASPVLDVRFSRRWYAGMTATAAAVLLVIGIVNLHHLMLLEIALMFGFLFVNLNQSALGGWLSSIVPGEQQKQLSMWVMIGNIAGGAVVASFGSEVLRNLPLPLAATVLAIAVILPAAVFPFMEAPGPDRRLASETFSQFSTDVLAVLRRREVLLAVILFAAPAGTFSLTNMLGGLGHDFHVPDRLITVTSGVDGTIGGLVGCFLFPYLSRLMPLRWLYLAIAVTGSTFTLALVLLPHTPVIFNVAMIGECLFQSAAITASIAVAFETIGQNNPLASTTFCLIVSAYSVPISYMLAIDGQGYLHGGVPGTFLMDAVVSIVATLVMAGMLYAFGRTPATVPETAQ